tara:strand:+ start:80 stop:520 length:441 start_codon:yes stop_codon:yes gene_type:complete
MNIKNKKNLIIFAVIFLLQLWFVPNVDAQNHEIDMNEIEEELPATDPFASGAGAASLDQSIETNEFGSGAGIINNMKLVGTISGAHKKIAVLAMPDGRALKFEENEFATDNLQILEIYEDFIVIRVDAKDQFEVYMNNQIRPMEGN